MVGTTNSHCYVCGNIAVITGTLSSSSGNTSYYSYPSGWTDVDKIMVLSLEINSSGSNWRSGMQSDSATFYRYYVEKSASGIRVYNSSSTYYSKAFRVALLYVG